MLSKKACQYWGLDYDADPFGTHINSTDSLFLWPEFEDVITRICAAISKRQFLVVAGAACSAKTTAWHEAQRRLTAEDIHAKFCAPRSYDPQQYRDQTIYHAIKYSLDPPDGSRARNFKRFREDRAMQCRQLLEQANEAEHPVCLAVNDAHLCRAEFLLVCKRLWDDLYGFDRLLSIILIGQPALIRSVSQIREINERAETVRMPGLVRLNARGQVAESYIEAYLHHELARCGGSEFPLDAQAVDMLDRLARANWIETQDHPLVINRVVGRAMMMAHKIKASVIDADLMTRAMRATDD